MIPILYNAKETDFDNNGIGRLTDCITCNVTEERNGSFECEFSYPITGQFYEELSLDRIVKVKANEMSDLQLFRIYRIAKPINGICKYYCQHISYDLNGVVVNPNLADAQYQGEDYPFEVFGVTAQQVIDHVNSLSVYPSGFTNRFTITATSSALHDFYLDRPVSVRAILGGEDNSVLSLYGGEFEFDNFTVRLKESRGQDNGVTILYGKNLTDITAESSITDTYTAILPYAIDDNEDGLYTLPTNNGLVTTNQSSTYGEPRILPLDLTSEFDLAEEDITTSKLRQLANKYIENSGMTNIYQNIEVSFTQLWQTEEYKNIAVLERVQLCDTVTVKYPALGVSVKAKVIKTVYDCLKEKYEKVELGEAKSDLGNAIVDSSSRLEKIVSESATKSDLQKAIENATALITGQEGGYIVFNDHTSGTFYDGTTYDITSSDSGGRITEMLIMDTPDINTASKIWRYNLAGWGYSSTGYNGPFALAATNDGAIVADRITAGTLSADIIKAGQLTDAAKKNYWNLNNGEFRLSATAKVGNSTDSPTLTNYISSTAETNLMTQQKVFNTLTNNGELKGVYMLNGELYINGTYIHSGIINADLIQTGTIDAGLIKAGTIASTNGRTTISMATGTIEIAMGSSGEKLTLDNFGIKAVDGSGNTRAFLATFGTTYHGDGSYNGYTSTIDYNSLEFKNGTRRILISPTADYTAISIPKLSSTTVSATTVSATTISGTSSECDTFYVMGGGSEVGSFGKVTVSSGGGTSYKSKIISDIGEIDDLTINKINGHELKRVYREIDGQKYYFLAYLAS